MLEYQVKTLKKYFKTAIVPGTNKIIEDAIKQLKEYFDGKRSKFELPLDFPGTEFQVKVWNELLKIPYGKTISYEELANKTGHRGACRAVGTANGMNRMAIIIPCHRVVNKGGKLGGYGGGLWRKQWLLNLELNNK
jgi:AraC family transcriptional regulator of adaptative response/methylated-DNA-[protein]-cysteine methyltransferase